jgi:hypothetical protein
VCTGCGETFRVVKAKPGKTGKQLGEFIKNHVAWGNPPKDKHTPLKPMKGRDIRIPRANPIAEHCREQP